MTQPVTKLSAAFRETTIGDEVAIMRLSDGDFFSLTGTARAIWQAIDGTRSRDEIAVELERSFAAKPGEIAAEVDRFLGDLRQAGLLADG